MSATGKVKVHPLALTYPPMSGEEMEALVADIAARGLQRPIVLYEGMILDGRNRYLACEQAKVKPTFVDYEGDDPLGQVNSLNLNRDLTGAQRAVIAARQWGLNGYSKGGRPAKGKPLSLTAVSMRSLTLQFRITNRDLLRARDLLAEAPDLVQEVEGCRLSLAAAFEQLEDRSRAAAQKTKDAARIAEYREAISSGEMTLEEALQKVMEREREQREDEDSQRSARRIWFDGLAHILEWAERFLYNREDEQLAWYTQAGAPGADAHDINAGRIRDLITHLERVQSITFGGGHERTENRKATGPKARRGI